jgi:hypothetical protein
MRDGEEKDLGRTIYTMLCIITTILKLASKRDSLEYFVGNK